MKVVTTELIRVLDWRATGEFGIPGVTLMENAGRAVVETILREYGSVRARRIAVFCGSGNNGGDGFVIARYLHLAGANVAALTLGSPDALPHDARVQYEIARKTLACMPYSRESWGLTGRDGSPTLIVDALLGTGVKDAPREPCREAIDVINAANAPVIAVDIPSGVNADTGATPGAAVRATHTVTFAYPKLGLLLFPGAEHVGKLHIADIGFDWRLLEAETPYRLLTPGEFRANGLKPRQAESNKGDYGHVAIVAGSRGMAGAPCLVARACQRAGAGLVTLLMPASAQPSVAAKLDEQMTLPLADEDGALAEASFDAIAEFAEKATVLCVGPGLTTSPAAVAVVQRVIAEIARPLVLDADGLNALALKPDLIERRADNPRAPLLLTPHPGEAARLLGTSVAEVQSNRIQAALDLARRFRAVVILKGRYSLIADPEGRVAFNTTGNPGMATGGMGDTLTGILGGILSQGVAPGKNAAEDAEYRARTLAPAQAGALAVYAHGLAGDLAAQDLGPVGIVATDVIERLPRALARLQASEAREEEEAA